MAAAAAQCIEDIVTIPGGSTIACQIWNPNGTVDAVLLHGWLDNSASYSVLLPMIVYKLPHIRFICAELPGHGFSSHAGRYDVLSDASSIINFINVFCGPTAAVHLIGHSWGGTVAQLAAAVLGTRTLSVVLLDSLGPFTPSPTEAVASFAAAVDGRAKRAVKRKTQYASVEAAAKHYCMGNRYITMQNAIVLMHRGTVRTSATALEYRHDAQLQQWFMSLSEDVWLAFISQITCTVTHIMAQHEQRIRFQMSQAALEKFTRNFNVRVAAYQHINVVRLTNAEHHAHMDKAADVAVHVMTHFEQYAQQQKHIVIAAKL